MTQRTVTLFGSSAPQPGEPLYTQAYDIGYGLAVAGYDLINGGHGGTMEASAHGARDGGAHVLGVTCGPVRSARGAIPNPYLDETIDTA